jgi:hypothetical protein
MRGGECNIPRRSMNIIKTDSTQDLTTNRNTFTGRHYTHPKQGQITLVIILLPVLYYCPDTCSIVYSVCT